MTVQRPPQHLRSASGRPCREPAGGKRGEKATQSKTMEESNNDKYRSYSKVTESKNREGFIHGCEEEREGKRE